MGKDTQATRASTTLISLVAALIAFTATQNAWASDQPDVAGLGEQIEIAYQLQDLAGIQAARSQLLDVAAGGSRADRASYFAAFARFRQAQLTGSDAAAARAYLEDCIGELKALVARQPADAEARALLGSCYGISTRYNRLAMASRGLAARREMAAAREMAPDNPWVTLQDGLADYATPRLVGGDRKLAINKLERATRLFDAAMANGSRLAAWGAAEAWLQLGQMYRESGRDADATHAADRARRFGPAAGTSAASLAAL